MNMYSTFQALGAVVLYNKTVNVTILSAVRSREKNILKTCPIRELA